jgi:alpha-tubulin suppressor-like RCC1 family protein
LIGHVVAVLVLTAGPRFVSVTVGADFSCGLTVEGRVYCWGRNDVGQLGIGTADTLVHDRPTAVGGSLAKFRALSAGRDHVCALLTFGALECWGDDSAGELGIGGSRQTCARPGLPPVPCSPSPRRVVGGVSFTVIGAGYRVSCGASVDQAIYCWGLGNVGRLGVDSASLTWCGEEPAHVRCSRTPRRVDGRRGASDSVRALAVGAFRNCALAAGGSLSCWGYYRPAWATPVESASLMFPGPLTAVTSGYQHACVIMADSTAACWGWRGGGALGLDSVPARECCSGDDEGGAFQDRLERLRPVAGGHRYVAISAGSLHTCAIEAGGLAYCWGDNLAGELGVGLVDGTPKRGDPPGHRRPERVVALSNVVSISAGLEHTCAVESDGSAFCWGRNVYGALGASSVEVSGTPMRVSEP